jgi:L-lactate dehydrogenase complex protein LldG
MTSRQLAGRRLSIFPPVHIVVATTFQLLPDIKDGLAFVQKKYGDKLPSMISLVTGASRTADIEKTLVLGAHGPKELVLFLIDDGQA